ncbi:MAG: hypothetical protein IJG40_08630 [Oscillospiraceae bacterium]|nr:hypothetical protein [Oscillospiraceae bacterium]
MAACGQALDRNGYVSIKDGRFWLLLAVYTIVFTAGLNIIWQWMEKQGKAQARERHAWAEALFGRLWLMMAIMLICWLPCYLSIFPGNFSYDSGIEYNQCAYGYNDAMPFLHSFLLVRILLKSMAKTGSVAIGVAVLTIGQMILLSGLFAVILRHFYRAGVSRVLLIIILVYYALFPTIHLLATCPIRDVLFSGLLTLSVFEVYLAVKEKEAFFRSRWRRIGAAGTVALTVLARNNSNSKAVYLLLLLIGILVFLWAGREFRRGAAWFSAGVFVTYFVLSTALSAACQPQTSLPSYTSLSFLTQPIARAYVETGDSWNAEELEEYGHYFETDDLLYVEGLGDISASKLKTTADESGSKIGFLRFWLRTGARHPGSYLNAWLANTKALWYPGAVIDGYNYEGSLYPTYKDYERSYFSFSEFLDSPARFDGKLPAVHRFYASIAHDISFEKIPVVRQVFSIGFYVWMLLFAVFAAFYRRDYAVLPALGILLIYVLVSMLVPVILVRYFAALFFAFPMVFVCLFLRD